MSNYYQVFTSVDRQQCHLIQGVAGHYPKLDSWRWREIHWPSAKTNISKYNKIIKNMHI